MDEERATIGFDLDELNLVLMALAAAAFHSPEGPAKERFRTITQSIKAQLIEAGIIPARMEDIR